MKNTRIQNPFLTFYGKHGISPVHQNIKDFRIHLARREKLYISLGLPPITFKNKHIVEIGPGGGYNALAFFSWGASVDFVEPNRRAREELPELLTRYKIKKSRWHLFPCAVEDKPPSLCYDIVIAEGFIPGLHRRDLILRKIKQILTPGGVVVVTCIDEIGYLLELIKRIVAHRLMWLSKVKNFNDSVSLLSRAFSSHLESLKFASRPIEDWVADQFLNPASYGNFFNIAECITEFGKEFSFLGSSPSIFVDYSWYKDISFDKTKSILNQYSAKRHMLLWHGLNKEVFSPVNNEKLAGKIYELRIFCKKIEKNLDDANIRRIISLLIKILTMVRNIDKNLDDRIGEAIKLLKDKNINEMKISKARKFASSFGRGQQYVSLVKRGLHSLK